MEASSSIVFSLFYTVFCTGFLYQAKEFIGAGLSPESLLSINDWIGSEEMRFFKYHMKRTAGTMVLHSLLPFGYMFGYSYFVTVDKNYSTMIDFWTAWPTFFNIMIASATVSLAFISLVWIWSLNNWERHPFVSRLKVYASASSGWRQVVADVETEFRRVDKVTLQTNPLVRLVVTDNWMLVIGAWPWSLRLSHQSDISLKLADSDHHQISTEGEIGGAQFLSIQVINRKPRIEPFFFRLNSLEYQNLLDKVSGPVDNVKNIQVYKTVSERFVDVFKEQISQNPSVVHGGEEEELEPCIGCMVEQANIKIQRVCASSQEGGQEGAEGDSCVNCYCRPMWCVDCMAKWFASRQDQSSPETWLGSKCPCPTCRSKFCLLDVCLIL